jgi:uroporphyrinogen-III synthase
MVTGRLVGEADDPQSIGTALAHSLAARRNSITDQASLVTLPLRGRRIVVTRAREQSKGLVEKLGALGAEVTVCPAIRIVPPDSWEEIDAAIGRLSSYDWVIFTSVNGVRVFFDRLRALGADTSQLCGRKLGAIGPATAEALEGAGCVAHFVPSSYVAEALVEQIGDVAGCRVLLPRADIAREALAEGLRAKGAHVDEVTAYRTVPGSAGDELANLLRAGMVDAITFTSSSTVSYTVRGLVGAGLTQEEAVELLSETNPVCIGPITAATASQHGLTIARTASEYTTGGLVDALLDLFGTEGAPGGGQDARPE